MKKEDKKAVMIKFQTHGNDTGSAPVQIAVLSEKIKALAAHLESHPKDKHSRRGLIGMVGQRRRLLRYLKMQDTKQYSSLTTELNIRK